MAASVGIYTVTQMVGALPNKGMATETSVRPGLNGFDIHLVGERPNVGTIRTITDTTTPTTLLNAYSGLQGTIQTITDDLGISNSYLITKVVNVENFAILKAVSGTMSGRTRLVIEWTLEAV